MDGIDNINTDELLQELGGCGLFQIILVGVFSLSAVPITFSFMIMTFGIYNPGWRCLDNVTSLLADNMTPNNLSNILGGGSISPSNETVPEGLEYVKSCPGFDTCQHKEFSPEAITIVSDWGLACDSAWIISTLLSLQMAGNLLGTVFVGYVGDRFGRKYPNLICMGIISVLNVISYFSTSWQMYGVLLFFMGVAGSFLMLSRVLMAEYVSESWRVRLNSLPTWTIISLVFAGIAMVVKDWKMLRLISGLLGIFGFVVIMWVPESLRWLIVRQRYKKAANATAIIAKINKAKGPEKEALQIILKESMKGGKESVKSYNMFHLFRKGYRLYSVMIGFLCLSLDLTYFTMSLGVIAMPGSIYINLIIFTASDIPANVLGFFIAGIFNRKPSCFVFFIIGSSCLFAVVALDLTTTGSVRDISVQVLVLVAKVAIYISWIILVTQMLEIYPTVVRSTVASYSFLCSNVGSVVAPYLIPVDPRYFYVGYLVVAILDLTCAGCLLFLPETRGRPLKDTWEDRDNSDVEKRNADEKDMTEMELMSDVKDKATDDDV